MFRRDAAIPLLSLIDWFSRFARWTGLLYPSMARKEIHKGSSSNAPAPGLAEGMNRIARMADRIPAEILCDCLIRLSGCDDDIRNRVAASASN